jgi:transcriptional regulator with XRE-family HTH domain
MDTKEFSRHFADRLVRMREQRRMSVDDLAQAAGTSYQTIWRIEQKHAEPGLHLATRLARALNCSLDYLCDLYAESEWEAAAEDLALV